MQNPIPCPKNSIIIYVKLAHLGCTMPFWREIT